MTPKIIVIDDFLPKDQLDRLRKNLVASKFARRYHGEESLDGVCTDHLIDDLPRLLRQAHGGSVTAEVKLQFARLSYSGDRDDTHCHVDSVIGTEWASVLYLTPGMADAGGTAFWRSWRHGFDALPSDAEIAAGEFYGYGSVERFHIEVTRKTTKANEWSMTSLVGWKYNRLVTYPTNLFHSRFPGIVHEHFGKSPDTGRMIHVSFYNLSR